MSEASPNDETRPSLLIRIRDSGDDQAWERFVRLYGALILAECRRRGLRASDAEDVTQLVFARILRSVQSFDYSPEKGRFRDWLGTIVRNEVFRFYRSEAARREQYDPVMAEAHATDDAWNEHFTAHVLRVALAECKPHFEPQTWSAFEHVWVEQKPAAQVARELGVGIDMVYVAKSRVLKRLAAVVSEISEDLPIPG